MQKVTLGQGIEPWSTAGCHYHSRMQRNLQERALQNWTVVTSWYATTTPSKMCYHLCSSIVGQNWVQVNDNIVVLGTVTEALSSAIWFAFAFRSSPDLDARMSLQ